MSTVTESDLVARARGGDELAFARLVQAHRRVAERLAGSIAGSTGDAEDAVQDAFVKAWHALDRFRPGAPFRPWLLRIVANETANRRRSASRRAGLAARAAAQPERTAPSPETAALRAEDRTLLVRALRELPVDARRVIVCRYLLELSEEESAAVLGCRRGTVKSRLSRSLDRLRVALENQVAA